MAEAQLTYALGRDCELRINGTDILSAEDVLVRETTVTVPATVRNSSVTVSIPIQRALEIEVSLAGMADVRYVLNLRTNLVAGSLQPNIVTVSLAGGVFNETDWFTIHDVTGDEPLNGPVVGRFALRQWVGMQAGPVGTLSNATPPAGIDSIASLISGSGSWLPPTGATGSTGPYINSQ